MSKPENDVPKPSKWAHESFHAKTVKVTPPVIQPTSEQDEQVEIAIDKEISSFLANLSIG